jgi:hypothetical protein
VLVGSTTSHKLQVVTSAAADIEVAASVVAVSTATPPVVDGSVLGPILLASITTAVASPGTAIVTGAASLIKRVTELSLRNNHASTACDVTIERADGTNTETVVKASLLAGESLVYTGGTWLHYDVNGAIYPSVGNAATQAEMEAGTSTSKYVTPQGVNWHPGTAKCWGKAAGAGTTLHANWNLAGIADTGTGRLGWTIGTDFSDTHWAALTSLQRVATSLAVASVDIGGGLFRNAGQTAAVIESENFDETATTNVAQDPEFYYMAGFGDQA